MLRAPCRLTTRRWILPLALALLAGAPGTPVAQAQSAREVTEQRRAIALRMDAAARLISEGNYEEASPKLQAIWSEAPIEWASTRLLLADLYGPAAFKAAKEVPELRAFYQGEFDKLDDKVQNDGATFLELDLWLILAHILDDGASPIEWFDRVRDFEIAPQAFSYLSDRLSRVLIQRSRFDDLILIYQDPEKQIEIFLKRIRRHEFDARGAADPEAARRRMAPQLQMLRREVSLRLIAMEAAGLNERASEASKLIVQVDPSEEMANQVRSAYGLLVSAGDAATRSGRVRVFTADGQVIESGQPTDQPDADQPGAGPPAPDQPDATQPEDG